MMMKKLQVDTPIESFYLNLSTLQASQSPQKCSLNFSLWKTDYFSHIGAQKNPFL